MRILGMGGAIHDSVPFFVKKANNEPNTFFEPVLFRYMLNSFHLVIFPPLQRLEYNETSAVL